MPAIAITALCDPVAIVHIPISLADVYTTKIYWTLDCAEHSSPEFFNITSNRIEMAIFGSVQLITQEWANLHDPDVLINATWRVFEISSGDEGDVGNYDSPHLRHVSAPLARAGISILYQSSYFTDFLLVKESEFEKAAGIFARQGWHLDNLSLPPRYPPHTPLTSTPTHAHQQTTPSPTRTPPTPRSALSPAWTARTPPLTPHPEITVLPNPLACVGLSPGAGVRLGERVRKFLVWPKRAVGVGGGSGSASGSGSGGVGASMGWGGAVAGMGSGERWDGGMDWEAGESEGEGGDEGEGGWESETEVSDLVPLHHPASPRPTPAPRAGPSTPTTKRPFISYTRNEDGASLVTEIRVLRAMFAGDEDEVQSGGELGWGGADAPVDDDEEEDDDDDEGEDERHRWMGWSPHSPPDSDSLGMSLSVSMRVGLDAGLLGEKTHRKTYSLPSSPYTPHNIPHPPLTLRLPAHYPDGLVSPLSASVPGSAPFSAISASTIDAMPTDPDLAMLTDNDQAMDMDMDMDMADLPIRWSSSRKESRRSEGKGKKRCLQLDLRGFGDGEGVGVGVGGEVGGKGVYHLDKSGLVTRFSSLLTSSRQPIRMLYSSTFHTANILVESRDVRKAKGLLEMRRRSSEWC
ncbi:hypothetical protein IAT38_006541 [Cryptococcus sp. DSM 104549]